MNYTYRFREAARKLGLLRKQHKALTKQHARLRANCILADNSHNRLFLVYEEALRLNRRALVMFSWMHDISTGRVAYPIIESELSHKVSNQGLRELYQGSRSSTRLVQVKALTILFDLYGVDLRMTAKFLRRGLRTLKKYLRRFRRGSIGQLLHTNKTTKCR
jgi:hypothetical protein